MRPAWVRAASSVAPSFGARRRVLLAWIWWDCDPLCSALRSTVYWCRHPVLFVQVKRRVALLLAGRDVLEA
jgi:hypothetical protein